MRKYRFAMARQSQPEKDADANQHAHRHNRLAFLLIAIVVVVRVVLALMSPGPEQSVDALSYDEMSRRLLETGEYSFLYQDQNIGRAYPNAIVSPGYPTFLAGIYLIAGVDAPAQPAVSIAQALLSGVTLLCIQQIAKHLAGPSAGLTAVVVGLAYIPHWWSYRYVLTEDLFGCLCIICILLLLKSISRRSVGSAALFGALLAAAISVRAVAAFWAALLLLIVALAFRRELKSLARPMLVAALVCILALSPWWIRNALIYERFVPFSTMGAAGSLVATFPEFEDYATWYDSLGTNDPYSPSDELAINSMNRELASERVLQQLRDNPLGFMYERFRQAGVSVLTYDPNPGGNFRGVAGLALVTHLSIYVLAAVTVLRQRTRPEILIVASLPIAQVIFYSTTLILSRYLAPGIPALIVLAALAVHRKPIALESSR